MFVGEDSVLGEPSPDDVYQYFPETWKDWSPGLTERAEWAYKYYQLNAVTVIQKPIGYWLLYHLGHLLELIFGDYYHLRFTHYKHHKQYRIVRLVTDIVKAYDRDCNTGRSIKLMWRLV